MPICLTPDVKYQTSPPAHFIAQALQLQVTGTGRTTMVDASPTMTAARLSRVIAARTGVPQGSFALYYRSRPIYGTLAESGVAAGSTIELKSRGLGGCREPPAPESPEIEIETRPPKKTGPAGVARGPTAMMRGYDRDGDGNLSRDEVSCTGDTNRSTAEKQMLSGSICAKVVVACKVVALMFAFSVPCWKVCRHGMLTSAVFRTRLAQLAWPARCSLRRALLG